MHLCQKPSTPPAMNPSKLVTMTISAKLNLNFNLRAIAEKIEIDHQVTGVKYLNTLKGDYVDEQPGRFKNQCTFRINVGDKIINTKIFNNGEIVNVGCLCQQHAVTAISILVQRFQGLDAELTYHIPDKFRCKELKKFFKDEIRKKYGDLYQMLILYFGLQTDLEPFDSSLSADVSYKIFNERLTSDKNYAREIQFIHTVISILKCYYSEDTEKTEKYEKCESDIISQFGQPDYQRILALIAAGTNYESGMDQIKCILPSCLSEVKFDGKVTVELINKGTNCNYYVNRKELSALLETLKDPDSATAVQPFRVVGFKYCKSYYPGVIIQYAVPGKVVKIIVFHTGKINITSANTDQQVEYAYQFIRKLCYDYFDRLVLTTAYENKQIEYEASLPDQYLLGSVDGQTNYLLRKKDILNNPRNIRILHCMGLLNLYCADTSNTAIVTS